jgi:regulator of protease activity HflC (stomatin/prohibitin superfamily)
MPTSSSSETSTIKWIVAATVFIIALFVLLAYLPFTTVNAGHRGVVTKFGEVQSEVLSEGFHWYNSFTNDVHEIQVQTTSITFDDATKGSSGSMGAASKDLQEVKIAVVVNYHPDPTKVALVYQQFGEDYEANIVEPIIRQVVKNASAQFTAEELVTRRSEFAERVNTDLASRFTGKMMVFETANIVNIDFSNSFNKAIEAKVTAEQESLAEKNKLEKVKYEAQQQIERAKAEAETIRIKAEAVNKQGGADYVKLQAIQKWDGRLPQYTLGNNSVTPFVDLNSLK